MNILGCLFLIGVSFYLRHLGEPSIQLDIVSWSIFSVGLLLLIWFIKINRKGNEEI